MTEKYHMHLPEREISDEKEIECILRHGKYAVIAMCRENEPYIVTLSYGYDRENDTLFFHSAPTGLKLEFLKANPRVCATIIEDKGYIEEQCAHAYRSVVLYGRMSLIEAASEKEYGMVLLMRQLEPHPEKVEQRLIKSERFLRHTAMFKLVIDSKRAKEGQ